MTTDERRLYHLIHPAKVLADTAGACAALAAFWAGWPKTGVLIAIAAPMTASALLLRRADLEAQKRSRLGAYLKKYFPDSARYQRHAGFAVLAYGTWSRTFLACVLGAALIVHAWTQGLLIPRDVRK
jgi:hypothetical protein